MNDTLKLRKNIYNLRNVHLYGSQNPKTKPYGLHCIAYRASQIRQTFPIETRDSILLKALKHKIKHGICNSCPCLLLLQTLHSPLRIYLNVLSTLHIFSDGLIYVSIFKHLSPVLDQLQCANTFHLV